MFITIISLILAICLVSTIYFTIKFIKSKDIDYQQLYIKCASMYFGVTCVLSFILLIDFIYITI